jgi:phosphoglucomutase
MLTFGTGGLRGILGDGEDRMNEKTVAAATTGLALYLLAPDKRKRQPSVAISHDSRRMSREFALVTAGSLASFGIRAYLYPQLMPTPCLSFAVRALECDAGVMVTASHNPAVYNGYKVYGSDGCQITDGAAKDITEYIGKVAYDSVDWMDEESSRAAGLLIDIPEFIYWEYLKKTLDLRVYPQESAKLTVCYTPLNGAGLVPVADVLRHMDGVTVVHVDEQKEPDGNFPTIPFPNPELPDTLSLAIQTAKQKGASLVIATDPDSDRVGVVVRGESGEFQILTGNEVGLLLLESILSTKKKSGTLPENSEAVKTIVTSDLAFAIADEYGAKVRETLTGFKYIGEEIARLEDAGESARFVFGFEESCGYLAGAHVRDKDGVLATMLVVELAQRAASQGKTLLDLLASLYEKYGRIGTRLLSFDLAGANPMQEMRRLMSKLRRNPPKEAAGEAVLQVKDYLEGIENLPVSDVLSVITQNNKIIFRPSGTEPKVKVYLFAKGNDIKEIDAALDNMEALAKDNIK